jgi:GxxExxY protein
MPIRVHADLIRLTQREFAAIAYEVINEAFAVQKELGGLFDEDVYGKAVAERLDDMQMEVQVDVLFGNYCKSYFVDAVVSSGAIFEFKAVVALNTRHRSQLLNYLLLTEMGHGKLINFRRDGVEHQFVNTSLELADRRCFNVCDKEWTETDGFGETEKTLVTEMLRDWGTGLSRALYEQAVFYLLGVADVSLIERDVYWRGVCVATQAVPICGEGTAVRLTTFQDKGSAFEQELTRLMSATGIRSAQWINVARGNVTFKTLHLSAPNFSAHS